jgi:hypothetical protein
MELCTFRDRIYGKKDKQLYVFESLWDSFRPIERVAWNGDNLVIIDAKYKPDLFDDNYGYGSLNMKALCRELSQTIELSKATDIYDPVIFWKWCGETEAKWWFDRACVFADSCVPKDQQNWKSYIKFLQTRSKTLRRPLKGRMTRRLVPN